jgi:uncharacterized protein YqjF (DUF2071 family)
MNILHEPIRPVFLTAHWSHLINITYRVDESLLKPHLPDGLELDIYEDSAHVSLVAFDFLRTRVKGMTIPFHVNFPEINLRFYVRYGEKVGVVFIKEFVPRFWIAWVARTIYNEPYSSISMNSSVKYTDSAVEVHHRFLDYTIHAHASKSLYTPEVKSAEHHFKEHDLGFGRTKKGRTLAYGVDHPLWRIYRNPRVRLNLDFGKIYGDKWAFLTNESPAYTLLAEGSNIKVRSAFKPDS